MASSDALDLYGAGYAEARAKFLLAAAQAGGQLTSYGHPTAVGRMAAAWRSMWPALDRSMPKRPF
jgi:hypothetical protein